MKIKILAVGKIKEKWYAEALAEYVKRLDRFAAVEIFEADEGDVRDTGEASVNAALKKEAEQILPRLQGYTVALDIDGRQMSSTEIASLIHREKMNNSVFTFVVGGSHGLHRSVKDAARLRLSFGKITLPHTLCRVVLAEQVYRAFMINANSVYHK
ncbi:MAG TPA: 23S rRNA (pseudouridine(1915)-N(3))-methyltransferase RlmH [Clostridiales bacterium]|jgi:ribosomal RNA large subunit methyltransferase H|nr:MAG: 23S rRNA (pseudouridine(1915)-N(3))-methyltransferase RlmH [Subdoligranulum sp.]CDE71749.1 ribosomal RNA large subunit methyltransferase H [Subdoligranulum sp. CAG:314]HCW81339.1 23S rRNA (pseudouridine(1915)-N(3))-methyltransferase RlmH [Clostridiales bacterium]